MTTPAPIEESGRDAQRRPIRTRAPEGELLSALSALLLLTTMFAFRWYGVIGVQRSPQHAAAQSAAGAWSELTDVRWLMLLTVLVTLGSVVIHLSQGSHGSQTNTSPLVAALGCLTAALLIYRVLIDLPGPTSVVDAKLGALLGLLAAVGIACGGLESVRAGRARPVPRSRRRPDLAPGPRGR